MMAVGTFDLETAAACLRVQEMVKCQALKDRGPKHREIRWPVGIRCTFARQVEWGPWFQVEHLGQIAVEAGEISEDALFGLGQRQGFGVLTLRVLAVTAG